MNTELTAQVGFRIETDVFSKAQQQPVVQTKTLFLDGVAYDESRDAGQDITIVDVNNDRIVRLREAKKLKCTTPVSKLNEMLQLSKQEASANPRIAELLQSAELRTAIRRTHACRCQTANLLPQAGNHLRNQTKPRTWFFGIATTQMHPNCSDTFVRRGAPPYARLKLNELVMARGAVPEKIVLTIETGDAPQELTCNVHADWELSKEDRQRVGEIQEMLITFSEASVQDYAKATQSTK